MKRKTEAPERTMELIGSGCIGWGENPNDLKKVARINFLLPDKGTDLATVNTMVEERLRYILSVRYHRLGPESVFVFAVRREGLFPCATDQKRREMLKRYAYNQLTDMANRSSDPEVAKIYTDLNSDIKTHIDCCRFCRGEVIYFRAERDHRLIAPITDHDFKNLRLTQLRVASSLPRTFAAAAGVART